MMPDRPNNPTTDDTVDATGASIETTEPRATRQHLDTDALSAFLDDRLDGNLNTAATGHIAACPDCRRELAELRATVSLLGGLPQYRPRRSFTLGSEYAHPVRTNRLIRLLPMLPALRAATIAVFLLLVGVGAADVLTQIGEDSDDNSFPAAMTSEDPGETAMQPANGVDEPAGEGPVSDIAPTGDGTGGEGGTLGRTESAADEVTVGDAPEAGEDAPAADSAPPPLGAMTGEEDDSSIASDDVDTDAPADAPAMEEAEPEPAGESNEPGESSFTGGASADSAAGDSFAEAPADGESAGQSQRSAAVAPQPTAPAAVVATESPAEATQAAITAADTVQTTSQRAGSTSDSGISTWRLIEYVLGIALIALVVLVFVLHRLSLRARRIGLVR